jgi:predicted metalloprotease
VYLDLGFFDELQRRFGAPGEFARAYVIAHEVGHHVQSLQGTSERVHAARQTRPGQANRLSVLLELQADCYAGVWAHHTEKRRAVLEPGDIEAALRAATAIGDDTLQRRAQGRVVPETFTHGTSAQRVEWFSRGLREGTLSGCDTFGAATAPAPR